MQYTEARTKWPVFSNRFKCIFLNEKFAWLNEISLNYACQGLVDNIIDIISWYDFGWGTGGRSSSVYQDCLICLAKVSDRVSLILYLPPGTYPPPKQTTSRPHGNHTLRTPLPCGRLVICLGGVILDCDPVLWLLTQQISIKDKNNSPCL